MRETLTNEACYEAETWLRLWADCLRAREPGYAHRKAAPPKRATRGLAMESRSAYATGAPDGGMFRPADDPPQMAFVFLQVESVLGGEECVARAFARHVWLHRKPLEEFRHPGLKSASRATLYRYRKALVERLAGGIGRGPETISSSAREEALLSIRGG